MKKYLDIIFLILMFLIVFGLVIYKELPASKDELKKAQLSSSCVENQIETLLEKDYISKNALERIMYKCGMNELSQTIQQHQKESLK